jgi:hypothetical protein
MLDDADRRIVSSNHRLAVVRTLLDRREIVDEVPRS